MKILWAPASFDDLLRLLRAWRLWLLAALLGGLAGVGFYYVNPPEYRARATVVVSFNMEKSWPNKPDNELFYYLERESRKVAELAWADATLQQVASQTGLTVSVLRSGKLELSQPQDGGWHFYANDASAETAEKIASAWAKEFTTRLQQGIHTAVMLDSARKALATSPDNQLIQAEIRDLERKSIAITPELQVSLAQVDDLPVSRKSAAGLYVAAGAVLFLTLTAFGFLFFGSHERH